jgi:polygalacturonase
MSSNVTKRALSAGLGVGALALLAPRASADTPFSSFAFRATGAPTARTLPDRLGELKNVKDFGARGNAPTNDTAAIQAAVNQGGRVFFPDGTYNISSPIVISGSEGAVHLVGSDNVVLNWVGQTAGFMIDRTPGADEKSVIIEGLHFRNMSWWLGPTNGCIRMAYLRRLTIRDCHFESRNCIKTQYDDAASVPGGGIHATAIERCHFRGVADPNIQDSRNWGSDSTAIEIRGFGICDINNIDVNGFNKGVSVNPGVASVKHMRVEMVDHGVHVGGSSGIILEDLQMEANFINFIWVEGNSPITARNVFCLADGWENNNAGVTDGIRIGGGADVYLENVQVVGFYSSSGIRFEAGAPPQGVFIKVKADLAAGSAGVAWKNFATTSKLTFIQCNHP